MIPRLVIGPGTIDKLMQDPRALQLLPFLTKPPRQRPGCGGCGKKPPAGQAMPVDYNAVKRILATLLPEAMRELKNILDAAELVFPYRDAKGRLQRKVV